MLLNYYFSVDNGKYKVILCMDTQKQKECENVIMEHCLIAGGSALIPIPFADVAVCLPNLILMYRNINKVLGIDIAEEKIAVIASFMLSQLGGLFILTAIFGFAKIAGGMLKIIPFNLSGLALDAVANATITYLFGTLYKEAVENIDVIIDVDVQMKIQNRLEELFKNKKHIKDILVRGKRIVKNLNFRKKVDNVNDAG